MQNEKIRFKGMKPSRSITRCVELQIRKWIEIRRPGATCSNDVVYDVEIEKGPHQPQFECLIWIRVGAEQWFGQELGRTLQSAVEYTLRRMRAPASRPEATCPRFEELAS